MATTNMSSEKTKSWNLVIIFGAIIVMVALGVFGILMFYGDWKSGNFIVKYKETELNFSVDSDAVSVEELVELLFKGERAGIAAAYLEQKGTFFRYGSPALLEKIKAAILPIIFPRIYGICCGWTVDLFPVVIHSSISRRRIRQPSLLI